MDHESRFNSGSILTVSALLCWYDVHQVCWCAGSYYIRVPFLADMYARHARRPIPTTGNIYRTPGRYIRRSTDVAWFLVSEQPTGEPKNRRNRPAPAAAPTSKARGSNSRSNTTRRARERTGDHCWSMTPTPITTPPSSPTSTLPSTSTQRMS